jgi:hypothetical protein
MSLASAWGGSGKLLIRQWGSAFIMQLRRRFHALIYSSWHC